MFVAYELKIFLLILIFCSEKCVFADRKASIFGNIQERIKRLELFKIFYIENERFEITSQSLMHTFQHFPEKNPKTMGDLFSLARRGKITTYLSGDTILEEILLAIAERSFELVDVLNQVHYHLHIRLPRFDDLFLIEVYRCNVKSGCYVNTDFVKKRHKAKFGEVISIFPISGRRVKSVAADVKGKIGGLIFSRIFDYEDRIPSSLAPDNVLQNRVFLL